MSGDIGGRTARGALWIATGEVGRTLAQGLAIVLGPLLLGTYEYGTAAMALVVLGAMNALTQAGFRQAIVQREAIDDVALDTAWTLLLGRGVLLATGMYLCAPALAGLFSDAPPELVPMLQVAALALLFPNLQSPGVLEHIRELRFKKLVPMTVTPPIVQSLVILAVLLATRSPWAFVWGRVSLTATEAILSYVVAPRRPRLRIDWAIAFELARFGRWIFLVTGLTFITYNLDNVLVGRWLGMSAIGIYKLAYDLSQLSVDRVAGTVAKATMPGLARVQNDRPAVQSLFGRSLRAVALVALPATVAVAVFLPDVVAEFKPGYEAMIVVCWVLCFAAPLRMIAIVAGALFRGLGVPRVDLVMHAWRLGVLALGIKYAIDHQGLIGLAALVVLANLAGMPAALRNLRSLADLGVGRIVAAMAPALYLSAVLGVAGWLVRSALPAGFGWATLAGVVAVALTAGAAFVPRMLGLWDPVEEVRGLRRVLKKR